MPVKSKVCGIKCVADWLIRPMNGRVEGNRLVQRLGDNETELTMVSPSADILRLTEVVDGAMIGVVIMICQRIGE